MSLVVSIDNPDLAAVAKILKGISDQKAPQKAINEAINRALLAGQTEASKGVRGRYNVNVAGVKANLELKKSSWSTLTGSLEYRGPMLPVEMFKPTVRTQRTFRRGPRRQFVSIAVIKGSRKKVTGAFMGGGGEAGVGGRVYQREGESRYPIFRVYTIGLPYMVRQTGILNAVEARMSEVYNTRLEHNINAFLTGAWGGRGGRR